MTNGMTNHVCICACIVLLFVPEMVLVKEVFKHEIFKYVLFLNCCMYTGRFVTLYKLRY